MGRKEGLFRFCNSQLASVDDGNSKRKCSSTWIWQNLDFDNFRPELLKTRIARIERGSHTEGFLKSDHIYEFRNFDEESFALILVPVLLLQLWTHPGRFSFCDVESSRTLFEDIENIYFLDMSVDSLILNGELWGRSPSTLTDSRPGLFLAWKLANEMVEDTHLYNKELHCSILILCSIPSKLDL